MGTILSSQTGKGVLKHNSEPGNDRENQLKKKIVDMVRSKLTTGNYDEKLFWNTMGVDFATSGIGPKTKVTEKDFEKLFQNFNPLAKNFNMAWKRIMVAFGVAQELENEGIMGWENLDWEPVNENERIQLSEFHFKKPALNPLNEVN